MNKTQTKKFIDIALIILFIIELGGFFVPSNIHVILGILFFILILIHNILNIGFYKNLFNGKYNWVRTLNTLCIFLFGISIIALAISGIAITSNLFPANSSLAELNWRSIHLNATIISLILLVLHVFYYSKRYFNGKSFYYLSIFALLTAISSIFILPYLERWCHKVNINKDEIIKGEKIVLNKKVLTVYFTRVGNTDFPTDVDAVSGASVMREGTTIYGNSQIIAYMIQDAVGGDIEAITTEKKYLPGYMDTIKEAGKEFSDTKLPIIKSPIHKPTEYDVIFLVYPLWWGTFPKAVESYLKQYNLSDKYLIPIVTHGGGKFGRSNSEFHEKIKAKYPSRYLEIYSSYIPNYRQKITDYIKTILPELSY